MMVTVIVVDEQWIGKGGRAGGYSGSSMVVTNGSW